MKRIILVFVMTFAITLPLVAADYYVSPNGNDSAAGTHAQPWQHIQHAVTNAMPGDTVYIMDGRYLEHVQLIRSGTHDAPITFAAMPGHTPVIDGEDVRPEGNHYWAGLFEIVSLKNIRVEGLTAINSYSAGFFVRWSSNVFIVGNATSNTFASGLQAWRSDTISFISNDVQYACMGQQTGISLQECITVAGVTNFLVACNHVYNRPVENDTNGGEGIDAKQACYRGVIRDNYIHDIKMELALYVDAYNETLQDIHVYNNRIHDCISGITVAAETSSGRVYDVRIYNNLIYRVERHGIDISDNDADARKERIDIYNNTSVSNGWVRWGGGISIKSRNVRDIRIFNNLCADNRAWQIAIRSATEQYIDTFNNGVYPYRNYNDEEKEIRGTDSIEENPQFINASADDYALLEFSPMINNGTNLFWHSSDKDITGNTRVYDGRVDIGAFEAVPEPAFIHHFMLISFVIITRLKRR